MKIVRSNKGGRHFGIYDEIWQHWSPFAKFLKKHGICAQYKILGTLQQNGV